MVHNAQDLFCTSWMFGLNVVSYVLSIQRTRLSGTLPYPFRIRSARPLILKTKKTYSEWVWWDCHSWLLNTYCRQNAPVPRQCTTTAQTWSYEENATINYCENGIFRYFLSYNIRICSLSIIPFENIFFSVEHLRKTWASSSILR